MNEAGKARACELAGRLIGQYLERMSPRGPFASASFVAYPKHSPLGIRALRGFPPAWYEDIKIPGYVIERVGEYGIRIY